jgi:rare lipoprotein A
MKNRFTCLTSLKFIPIAGLCAAFLLAGCAETRLALHAAKKLRTGPETPIGIYKVGKPYRIGGIWYYPKVDYSYQETGIASWYGRKFHKRQTANGQIFDMNAISAAHRTLPLPSMVQVTNLKNGRSLKVLVNDRGPFAHGRIIDLSRRAAQLLGYERAGIARVRVEIIADESRRLASLAQGPGANKIAAPMSAPVKISSLPAPASEDTDLKIVPVSGKTSLFVQAGAFVRRDLAVKMKQDLALIGPTQIVEARVGERRFFRVRLGPVATVNDGDRILDAVVRTGYPDARLVVY